MSVLLSSDLRRHTATLLSGSGFALLVTVGLQPILTRLFSPVAFGIADAFVSLVAIVLPIASLKYEDAIMIPARRSDASTILTLAALVAFGVACCVLALSPVRQSLATFLGSPALTPWLLLAAPAILLYRFAELAELWLARSKRFGLASVATATRAGAMGGTRLIAGLVGGSTAGPGGLIGGFIAGYVASLVVVLPGYIGAARRKLAAISFRELSGAARRYARFPLFTMPSSVLASATSRLPFLLLLFYFDESTVGFFGRAFTALVVPLTLVGSAVARSFFVHASESHREGRLAHVAGRVHDRMVLIAMFPTVVTVVAGPELFSVVFGEEWLIAGQYARAAVLWFALVGITSPLTRIFDVTERQRTDFAVSAVTFLVMTAAFVAGSRSGDAFNAVAVGAVGGAVARLILLAIVLHIAGVNIRTAVIPYLRYAAYALPVAFLLLASTAWFGAAALISALFLGGLTYGAACYRRLVSTDEAAHNS